MALVIKLTTNAVVGKTETDNFYTEEKRTLPSGMLRTSYSSYLHACDQQAIPAQ
jgi:hypothetical protein